MTPDSLGLLLVPRPPWCQRAVGSHSDVTDGLWTLRRRNPGSAVIFLRGRKMRTVQCLFDEFSAALQFPFYFGNNGNALDECLADLSWMPATTYVLTILDSADFLADEPAQLPLFVDAIDRVCAQWSTPVADGATWDRPAVPFHVIFHCVADDVRRLPARIAGITAIL